MKHLHLHFLYIFFFFTLSLIKTTTTTYSYFYGDFCVIVSWFIMCDYIILWSFLYCCVLNKYKLNMLDLYPLWCSSMKYIGQNFKIIWKCHILNMCHLKLSWQMNLCINVVQPSFAKMSSGDISRPSLFIYLLIFKINKYINQYKS